MLDQGVYLARLGLKVEHFGSQEAATLCCGSAATCVWLLLLVVVVVVGVLAAAPHCVPAVACSPAVRACFLASPVCLRICIVVHSVA